MLKVSNDNLSPFWKGIAAATIANDAVIKCLLSRLPLTEDNVLLFIGDFFDPTDPGYETLSHDILKSVEAVVICLEKGDIRQPSPK